MKKIYWAFIVIMRIITMIILIPFAAFYGIMVMFGFFIDGLLDEP